jgi:hypothetical protein
VTYKTLPLPKSLPLYGTARSNGTFTIVSLQSRNHSGTGVAKRHTNDTPNQQIGIDLATARALQDLGASMEEEIRTWL